MAQMTSYQVFPINQYTFKGVATNKAPGKYKVVLAEADGDITFLFAGTTVYPPVTITAVAGQSFGIDEFCTGVTSLASVVIS